MSSGNSNIELVQRLADGLNSLMKLLESEIASSYHLVFVPDDAAPTHEQFATIDALSERILALRAQVSQLKQADPTRQFYLFVFHGTRWQLCATGNSLELRQNTTKQRIVINNGEDLFSDPATLSEPPATL